MTDYNASRRFIKARSARLVGILPGRSTQIQGLFLHSTRSGVKDNGDGPGTENWATSSSNPGAYWDMLIFGTGQQVKSTYWERDEQPLWCAGKGGEGTWSAQDNFIQVEISQGTIDSKFTPESIESLCQFTAEMASIYKFPIIRIPDLVQVGVRPWGIADHANSANGRYYGKSDVGPLFSWWQYIQRSNEILKELTGEQGMTPEERKEFDELKKFVAQLRTQAWGPGKGADGKPSWDVPPPMRDSANPYADATMYDVAAQKSGRFTITGDVTLTTKGK